MGGSTPAEGGLPAPGWYRDPGMPEGWRWWDGGAWSPYTATASDQGSWRAPPARAYDDPKLVAGLVRAVLLAAAVVGLTGVVVRLAEWSLLADIAADPATVSNGEVQADSNRVLAPWVAEWVTLLLGVLTVALWTDAIYANLPALGASRLRFGRRWAAGGFFVPGLNLFRPVQVLGDVWRGSDPGRAAADPAGRKRPASRLAVAWFVVAWLAVGFHWSTFPLVDVDNDLPGDLGDPGGVAYDGGALWANSVASLVGHALVVVASVLGIVVVRSLSTRQRALAVRVTTEAPSGRPTVQPGPAVAPGSGPTPPAQGPGQPVGDAPPAGRVLCPDGHPNTVGQQFCGQCGAPLAARELLCPRGHVNPAANQFCGECGVRLDLSAAQPAEEPAAGAGVRPDRPGEPAAGGEPGGPSRPTTPTPSPADPGVGWGRAPATPRPAASVRAGQGTDAPPGPQTQVGWANAVGQPLVPYRSIEGLGAKLDWLFTAVVRLDVLVAAIGLLSFFNLVGPVSSGLFVALNVVTLLSTLGLLVLCLGVVPLYVTWLYRGYQNLPALGARGLRFNPGSAVLVCFLPILNYFLVNKVLNDLWRASDPTLPVDPGDSWKRRPLPGILRWWWAELLGCTLAGLSFGALSSLVLAGPEPPILGQLRAVALARVVLFAYASVVAVQGRWIVRQITSRQQRRESYLQRLQRELQTE